MANPDISLLGATYSGVSGVTLPKNGGGTATFPWVEGSETKTQNGTYDVTTLAQLIVNVSGGGGGGASKKQVNFIDYDGTLLYSYTKAEINAMSSESDLPANPSHTGLVAQGWNWTLAQIKAQLTAMPDGDVWVGQMYITQSGNTEIDVSMPKGRLSPTMTIAVNGTITVDWGDNTTPDTVTGTSLTTRQAVPHTYASPGDYTIVISVISGNFAFYGTNSYLILRKNTKTNENRVYANCVKNVRLGSGITSIGDSAFYNCYSLASITIPTGVTSIGSSAFSYCYSLASITIPAGITSIGSYALYYCSSLASITIPTGVTSIGSSAFYNCYGVSEYHLLPTTPPTLANTDVFNSIVSDCIIYVPYSADHSILNAYKTASNWSTYASKMQEEPQ